MRVLLVEDNARLRALTQRQLRDAGFAVDAVGERADAEAAVRVESYDAIVLDLGLPDGDGGEFLRALRAAGRAIPVLVLTARDGLDDRVTHLDWGADDYMVKPFAAAAEAIGPHSSGVRLPDRFVPREILPLIDTVNRGLERLERTLAAQRAFTADAAHELKTPLAVMRAQIDAMRQDEDIAALREDVERMSRLVSQMLRLAEADQLAVPPDARADLSALARDVTAGLAPLALARGRSLTLDGAEEPVWVRGLGPSLAQAIRNLVENALKHTPAGTRVELHVTPTGALLVRDHGPGVPETERAHVFKRFWRKDRGDGDGAGLGLAIAAKIVEAHGGHVSLADAPGGGAIFAIDLLRAAQPARTAEGEHA